MRNWCPKREPHDESSLRHSFDHRLLHVNWFWDVLRRRVKKHVSFLSISSFEINQNHSVNLSSIFNGSSRSKQTAESCLMTPEWLKVFHRTRVNILKQENRVVCKWMFTKVALCNLILSNYEEDYVILGNLFATEETFSFMYWRLCIERKLQVRSANSIIYIINFISSTTTLLSQFQREVFLHCYKRREVWSKRGSSRN